MAPYDENSTAALPVTCVGCGGQIVVPCTYLFMQGRGCCHVECAEKFGYAIVLAKSNAD